MRIIINGHLYNANRITCQKHETLQVQTRNYSPLTWYENTPVDCKDTIETGESIAVEDKGDK